MKSSKSRIWDHVVCNKFAWLFLSVDRICCCLVFSFELHSGDRGQNPLKMMNSLSGTAPPDTGKFAKPSPSFSNSPTD